MYRSLVSIHDLPSKPRYTCSPVSELAPTRQRSGVQTAEAFVGFAVVSEWFGLCAVATGDDKRGSSASRYNDSRSMIRRERQTAASQAERSEVEKRRRGRGGSVARSVSRGWASVRSTKEGVSSRRDKGTRRCTQSQNAARALVGEDKDLQARRGRGACGVVLTCHLAAEGRLRWGDRSAQVDRRVGNFRPSSLPTCRNTLTHTSNHVPNCSPPCRPCCLCALRSLPRAALVPHRRQYVSTACLPTLLFISLSPCRCWTGIPAPSIAPY